ncbi:MAG: hypothetical protein HQ539_02200 [Parcubacteria group bacterium]|nr:hypothetical protein [Parcubacteria group bacterium]
MNPQKLRELYNKEVKPLSEDWSKADEEYWPYLEQLLAPVINEKIIWEETKPFSIEKLKKLEQMEKDVK